MKAMILAAGLGTRLRPRTLDRPKALVEVAGRPLIGYGLALLRHHDITDVIINLHHHGDALAAALGDGERFGVRIQYSHEDPLLDTGGAIKKVVPLLAGAADVLVLNADTIIDVPLDRLVRAHHDTGAAATLVLREDPEQARYGLLETDATMRVRRFLGTPAAVPEPLTPYMFAGVHVLSSRVFDYMPPRPAFSITRETYPAMVSADEHLQGFRCDGFWRVIDREADLVRAEAELARSPALHYLRTRPS
jgi:NDP-sugar pyrophosphorylase family protein